MTMKIKEILGPIEHSQLSAHWRWMPSLQQAMKWLCIKAFVGFGALSWDYFLHTNFSLISWRHTLERDSALGVNSSTSHVSLLVVACRWRHFCSSLTALHLHAKRGQMGLLFVKSLAVFTRIQSQRIALMLATCPLEILFMSWVKLGGKDNAAKDWLWTSVATCWQLPFSSFPLDLWVPCNTYWTILASCSKIAPNLENFTTMFVWSLLFSACTKQKAETFSPVNRNCFLPRWCCRPCFASVGLSQSIWTPCCLLPPCDHSPGHWGRWNFLEEPCSLHLQTYLTSKFAGKQRACFSDPDGRGFSGFMPPLWFLCASHCLQKRRIFLSLVGTPQECLPMSMQGWFNLFRRQHVLRKTGHGIKCPGILDPIPCGCIFRLLRQIGHMFTPYYVSP